MQEKQKDKLKILFFGLGSIGIKHARIIKENYNFNLFSYRTRKGQELNNLGIREFDNTEDAFSIEPDIAFITNPTHLHTPTALHCVKRNINLFIEKPLAHTLEDVEVLNSEIKKRNLSSYIAYNLRFHPVIEKIKEIVSEEKPIEFNVKCSSYLPDWRTNQDYSKSYSAKKEMGGGVTLDLSHEFDYITYLFGEMEKIEGYCDKISDLKIDSEDILEAEITCKSAVKGNIHLDSFTKKHERTIKIKFSEKIIIADLLKNTIKTIENNQEKTINLKIGKDETYKKQMQYFFKNYYEKNRNMMNNYSEALKTFKKIMDFKKKNSRV